MGPEIAPSGLFLVSLKKQTEFVFEQAAKITSIKKDICETQSRVWQQYLHQYEQCHTQSKSGKS